MKSKKRVLALLLAVVLLVMMLPPMLGTASATEESETSYTKTKVVSVLFDNSGSMIDGTNRDKWDYARYALETLMTTLGKNDKLIITPMNDHTGLANNGSEYIEVDLAAEDRSEVIADIFDTLSSKPTFLAKNPSGKTPVSTVDVALKQLVNRYGMKTNAEMGADEVSTSEYFLVVLTDGAFNPPNDPAKQITSPDELAGYFKEDLAKYASFQSIYIGFSLEALDMNRATTLANTANFSAYKAEDSDDIGGVMQQVANRITGRYPLTLKVDKNSKTVTIPLSDVPFSLRTVTVMATNTNARIDTSAASAPTYNGEKLHISQNASFDVPSGMTGMNGGFTAILSRGGNTNFSGGEIVLQLDEAPGDGATVSIFLEPALILEPVIEHEGKEIDTVYINSQMKKGDVVSFSYRIVEQGTNTVLDPKSIDSKFDPAKNVRITYNTKGYAPGADVTLVEGKKEIGISVSMMNGQYTLFASIPCIVLENAHFFRVESSGVTAKSRTQFEANFTVFYDNRPIESLALLEGYRPTVTAKTPDGTDHPVSLRKNANGTFTAVIDTTGCEYGTYTVSAAVKDSAGNPRTVDVPIGYFPTGLLVTCTGAPNISKTLHGILSNTEAFTFALTAEDTEIPFNNALLTYKLTVGGVDVTSSTAISGNVLTYVPTADSLGDSATRVGNLDVKLTVVFRGATTETVEGRAQLTLTDAVFEIVPLSPVGTVDRFALKDNQSSLYFRVLRDGVALPAEELAAALESGALAIDEKFSSFLSPVRTEVTVENSGGAPAIRVRFAAGHFGLLRGLVTSMLTFGKGLTVGVAYRGVSAESTMAMTSPGVVPYIWRILLILYIIQLVIVILTFFVFTDAVKRVPNGLLVEVRLKSSVRPDGMGIREVEAVSVKKKVTTADTLIPMRVVPFFGMLPAFWRKDVPVAGLDRLICDGDRLALTCDQKAIGEVKTAPAGFDDWRRRANPGRLTGDAVARARVECRPKTTNETKKQPLTASSGPVIRNSYLYIFIKRRK